MVLSVHWKDEEAGDGCQKRMEAGTLVLTLTNIHTSKQQSQAGRRAGNIDFFFRPLVFGSPAGRRYSY